MLMRMPVFRVACLSSVLAASSLAMGDPGPAHTVSHDCFQFKGWNFVPILQGESVVSIVMLKEPEIVIGDNISVLWCVPDGVGGWDKMAWHGDVHADAVLWIESYYGVAEHDAGLYLDGGLGEAGPVPIDPEPFDSGLYAYDPLVGVVGSMEDPDALLSPLESGGYPAASGVGIEPGPGDPGVIEQGCELTRVEHLDLVKAFVEAELAEPGSGEDVIDDLETAMMCCWPFTQINSGPWSPWVCGEWDPTHEGPSTVADAKNCFYERSTERTRWQNRVRRFANCSIQLCWRTQKMIGMQDGRNTVLIIDDCPDDGPASPCAATRDRKIDSLDWDCP